MSVNAEIPVGARPAADPALLGQEARGPGDTAGDTEGQRLRFIVCGSVDDGKSTLIGRLLWDTKSVADDHRAALVAKGSRQNDLSLPDFGLLLDGLKVEQEQGITIDVAYRYFQTPRRAFIVADTPGHEQYTRNMATGASTADLAVLLVDARAGLLEQTRRHAAIVHLMGIRQIVLAVNKIDLVNYDRSVFERIAGEFGSYAALLGGVEVTAIPVSALKGENVAVGGARELGWYRGPTLLEALEQAPAAGRSVLPFRMPVQRVSRPSEAFRGYQGTIAAGRLRRGESVVVAHSNEPVTVERIVTLEGDLEEAEAGDAVTLVLDRQVDASRGDILSAPGALPLSGRIFSATVVVLQGEGLLDGSELLLKAAGRTSRATVHVEQIYDLSSARWLPSQTLPVNAIGRIRLQFPETFFFDRFSQCRDTGAFILISRKTNTTLAGGMVLDLAGDSSQAQQRVTISLPRDLADLLLAHPAAKERRDEIAIVDDS